MVWRPSSNLDMSPSNRVIALSVDGVSWRDYEPLAQAGRLLEFHAEVHSGRYRAQPSRRVYIPKADGNLRPLGIAALEDKIVQQAVVTVLNEIYEVDFMGFSYGFRPGRSQHDALDALAVAIGRRKVNWILDAPLGWQRVTAQIRHRHQPAVARVRALEPGRMEVVFDDPQIAITPGQAVVCYLEDAVVGGGWID